MATTTANMGLSVPSVNDTDYPTSISDSFNAIDDHDHSSGNGVQIPNSGILDGAVGTSKLATNAVTTIKITDGNITEAKIATSAVTTTKIADSNVTTAKIADANVTEGKLASSSVTNSKLANSSISQSKMGAVNFNQSGGSGAFSTSSTSFVDVVSTTLTVSGRVVIVSMEVDGGGGQGQFAVEGAGTGIQFIARILRDGTPISELLMGGGCSVGVTTLNFPAGSVWCTDRAPGFGTVTYKLQVRISGGATIGYVLSSRLAATEIF